MACLVHIHFSPQRYQRGSKFDTGTRVKTIPLIHDISKMFIVLSFSECNMLFFLLVICIIFMITLIPFFLTKKSLSGTAGPIIPTLFGRNDGCWSLVRWLYMHLRHWRCCGRRRRWVPPTPPSYILPGLGVCVFMKKKKKKLLHEDFIADFICVHFCPRRCRKAVKCINRVWMTSDFKILAKKKRRA